MASATRFTGRFDDARVAVVRSAHVAQRIGSHCGRGVSRIAVIRSFVWGAGGFDGRDNCCLDSFKAASALALSEFFLLKSWDWECK